MTDPQLAALLRQHPAPPRPNQVGTVATQPAALLAAPRLCACFAGMCRCEVVDGRTSTGAHCRAHLEDHLDPTS